jgi:hypothetical protein
MSSIQLDRIVSKRIQEIVESASLDNDEKTTQLGELFKTTLDERIKRVRKQPPGVVGKNWIDVPGEFQIQWNGPFMYTICITPATQTRIAFLIKMQNRVVTSIQHNIIDAATKVFFQVTYHILVGKIVKICVFDIVSGEFMCPIMISPKRSDGDFILRQLLALRSGDVLTSPNGLNSVCSDDMTNAIHEWLNYIDESGLFA